MLIFGEKMLVSAELKRCATWFMYFWIFFRQGTTVPSFINVGYVWQILGWGAFLTPHSWAVPKKPILNRIKTESDLSTRALVAGMTNNISKTLITQGNIFPIWFSLMKEMVWERNFSVSFSFVQYRFHSFNFCWKVNGLGRSSF